MLKELLFGLYRKLMTTEVSELMTPIPRRAEACFGSTRQRGMVGGAPFFCRPLQSGELCFQILAHHRAGALLGGVGQEADEAVFGL